MESKRRKTYFHCSRTKFSSSKSLSEKWKFICMGCAIWYQLCNLKNMKNTQGGVLLLVKLQAEAKLLKVTFLHRCFSRFLNYVNCTNVKHGISSNKGQHLLKWYFKQSDWIIGSPSLNENEYSSYLNRNFDETFCLFS